MAATEIRDILSRTVRLGTAEDVEELARLCDSTPSSVRELQSGGDFLVLDRPGGLLAGAIYLAIEQRRARIALLKIAPEFADSDLAERLVAIAELMCEASGCSQVVRQLGV